MPDTHSRQPAPPSGSAGFRARPSTLLVLLLLGVYGYFYQAGGWNQNSRIDLVRALVEQYTFSIDRYEANTGDDAIRDGHYYCDKAPGASFLCVPPYWLTYRLAGAPATVPPAGLAWAVWFAITCAIGLPSALASASLARIARRLGLRPAAAVSIALLWSLGTMALPYSTLLYGNQLSASLMLIAFALFVDVRHGSRASTWRMLAGGALLGYAVATEYPAALIGVPIALYGLAVSGFRSSRTAIAGGLIPVVLLLGYHRAVFGSPFSFPYDYSVWETPRTGWFMGISVPDLHALTGILVGEYRGLLYATPWLAAACPGAVMLARRHGREALVCIWAVAAFLWLNASIPPWHGGWAAGPRYLVPMLPFLSLLAAGVLLPPTDSERAGTRLVRRALPWTLAVLGLVSVANMFAITAVKPELSYELMRPYHDVVWPRFAAGDLALSTQSIDAIDNPPGAPRQAWNLGMKAGLHGHASLAPLYAWALLFLAWLAVELRRSIVPSP